MENFNITIFNVVTYTPAMAKNVYPILLETLDDYTSLLIIKLVYILV